MENTYYGPDTGLHALPTFLLTSHSNPHIKRGIPTKMLSKHLVHGKASTFFAMLPIIVAVIPNFIVKTEAQIG